MSDREAARLVARAAAVVAGSPATGTIVHDYIFANGFD